MRLAEQQLAIHREKLAAYLEDERLEEPRGTPERGRRTAERWRGETLRMGLRYEEAAVGFWEAVVSDARVTAHAD